MHCMFIANLHIVSKDVYINAQMVIIIVNDGLLGLLMIIIEICNDIININETKRYLLFPQRIPGR